MYVYVCLDLGAHECRQPMETRQGIRSPRARAIGDKLRAVHHEPNLGLLQEQQVTSLQSLNVLVRVWFCLFVCLLVFFLTI